MPAWSGNTYNRTKELPKFLANINQAELQEFGRNKINKQFMTNYNYNDYDMVELSRHNQRRVISYAFITLRNI